MSIIEQLNVTQDVTLISLNDSPADIKLIADIFNKIAEADIDVDMISQSPPSGAHSSLSFTVSDNDFGKILEIAAQLRSLNTGLKITASSGNCKISLFGSSMRGKPGVAAAVFSAASSANADIRMITTSETDISILVVEADVDSTVKAIENAFVE
ncbi:MAG: ACT domain-containing protein [Acutalibacteraceae bacterium]|jgi:aspartokinase